MAFTSSSASNNLYGYLMSQSTGTSETEFENQLRLRAMYEGQAAQNVNPFMQSGSGATSPLATPKEKEAQPNPVLLLLEDL